MCTLIALFRCFDGAPLVVAANRDEFHDRPAEGPALRWTEAGAIVAPHDVRAGGTWLGLNAAGVFAAVTNRPCEAPDPERRIQTWQNGDFAYLLLASGMDPHHFATVAATAREAIRRHQPLAETERMALRDSRARSRPCLA